MAEKTAKKKTTKKKTAKQKLEDEMNEVEQAAKEYVSRTTTPNTEFPPITLPCRGYFKFLDQGLNVENLQCALNHLIIANIPVTGVYDEQTMDAVTKFEEQYGGCVNGKFGDTELKIYNKLRGIE